MTKPQSATGPPSASPEPVPGGQQLVAPLTGLNRIAGFFPGGQFARYLCVGAFNTVFGYFTFVVALTLLNRVLPGRFLYLTVILASMVASPISITVAFFGYKLFVFRTKGNVLREWLKCFAVYGTSMIPGLVALSALTKFLQSTIHHHAVWLHVQLAAIEQHLSGRSLAFVQRIATGKAMAGYIAGAVVITVSTIYSFIGHKKITFRQKPAPVSSIN
jgi:putative flippase GtrA